MNIITRFIEKLLYYNKKTIISIQGKPNSTIVAYNLTTIEQMILATATLSVLINENSKRNNLSYKDKAELVTNVIEMICETTGVEIKITIQED
ncbi:MAG TPA: hypothetical protein PKL04_00970 [Methanofastidiosum sp.]|nr:hypothetical protein [Methanofastidiosum sp.]